jgi:type I restriction enzyme, R subunit
MSSTFTESVVEEAALAWLEGLGYTIFYGPDIAAVGPTAERIDPNFRDVILENRVRQALIGLNPDLPSEALDDAYRKLVAADATSLIERNRAAHRMAGGWRYGRVPPQGWFDCRRASPHRRFSRS